MGKWIFRMLAMMAIGGAVIFWGVKDRGEPVREELVDLYFRALRDLIRSDFGLAEDVACFGFDFSQAGSLTEGEGKVLAERLKEKFHKSKVIFGTFEELEEAGYIRNDGGGICWSDGLLLTLKVTKEKKGRIVFSMSAWRSGDGAVGKDGCEASEEDGGWNFDFGKSGSCWIS